MAAGADGGEARRRATLRRSAVAAFLVLAVSFVPRYHFRSGGLFHVDEVVTARAAERLVNDGVLTGEVNGRYGTVLLTALFHAPYHAVTGKGAEAPILFLGVLAGSLAVLLAWLLVEELTGNRRLALLSAAFLNFNGLFLVTTTTGKEHTLLLFFLLLSLFLLFRGAREGSLPLVTLGAASYGAALTVHEAAIPFAPVVLAFLLHAGRRFSPGDTKRQLLAALLFLAFAALPFPAYLWRVVAEMAAPSGSALPSLPAAAAILLHFSRNLVESSGWPFAALLLPGLLLARRHGSLFVLLLLWLPLFLYFGTLPAMSDRYLLLVLVPLSTLPASAVDALAARFRSVAASRAVAAVAAALVCLPGIAAARPALEARSVITGPKNLARIAGSVTEPDAVILAMDEAPFLEYYGRRRTLPHPIGPPAEMAAFVQGVKERVDRGEHVYVVLTALLYDDDGCLKEMLDRTFDFVPAATGADEWWLRDVIRYRPITNGIYRIVPPSPRPWTVGTLPPMNPYRDAPVPAGIPRP
jgi:hypothetical protein